MRFYTPDPSIRGACGVVASGSHPHVLRSYAPVRSLAPPCTRRLLDGQGFQGVTTLPTDYGTPSIFIRKVKVRRGSL